MIKKTEFEIQLGIAIAEGKAEIKQMENQANQTRDFLSGKEFHALLQAKVAAVATLEEALSKYQKVARKGTYTDEEFVKLPPTKTVFGHTLYPAIIAGKQRWVTLPEEEK